MTTEPDRPTESTDGTWRDDPNPLMDPEPVDATEMGGLGDAPKVVHYSTGVVDEWVRCDRDELVALGDAR